MKYFEIEPKLETKTGWVLDEIDGITDDELWDYSSTREIKSPKKVITVKVGIKGDPIDYNLVYPEIIIVSLKVKMLIGESVVQYITVKVNDGGRLLTNFFVFKPLLEIDAVDEKKSRFKKWKQKGSIRPDLVGEYEEISSLKIDKKKVNGVDIFKIKGYLVSTIVSEKIKRRLEEMKITGIYFKEV